MLSLTTKLVGLAACGFIAVEAGDPCKNSGQFRGTREIDFGSGPQSCSDFTSFVPANPDDCAGTVETGGAAGLKANLYKMGTTCCEDELPTEICGPFPNPCDNPSDFTPDAVVNEDDQDYKCYMTFANLPMPAEEQDEECNGLAFPDDAGNTLEKKQFLTYVAGSCCGDDGEQSEICPPPPTPCKNPGQFRGTREIDFGSGPQSCSDFTSLVPTTQDACSDESQGGAAGVKANLYKMGTTCCEDELPSEICGPFPNPCDNPSDFTPDAVVNEDDQNYKCYMTFANLPMPAEEQDEECNGLAFPDDAGNTFEKKQFLTYVAGSCCGDDGEQSEICPPPPPPPNPCKNKELYNGQAPWSDESGDDSKCDDMLPYLPTDYRECNGPMPDSDYNKAWVLAYAAGRCCSDGVPDDLCEVGNPCKTTANFKPNEVFDVDDSGSEYKCANAKADYVFPANSQQCAPNDEGEHPGFERALHGAVKCCSGGAAESTAVCGEKPACFKTFYQCFVTDGQSSAITAAEAKLVTDNVAGGSCGTALANKVAGETCCTPLEKFAKCVGDFSSCPDIAGPPVNIVPAVVDSVLDAFKAGGYCVSKPWAMDKAAKKKFYEDSLAAAKEKKAKCGGDSACTQAVEAEITALEAEVQTIVDGETTTTAAAADDNAAVALGPAPVAALAAFSMAAVAAAVL